MPFDGKRMIMGGFDAIVEEGSERGGYTDGFVVPVPEGKRDAYRELASKMAKVFRQHGANRVVEAIADDVPAWRSHRLLSRGEGRGRRNGRLQLHRMAGQEGSRRRLGQDHGRREHEAGGRHAVHRPAHVLGRLRADPRQHAAKTPENA